jgi:NADH-quinone oxidoreductase subunit N
MDAILLLFITGILSLFLGMKNKPVLNLWLNLSGLCSAGIVLFYQGAYEPIVKSFSVSLVFTSDKALVPYSALALIFFTLLIQIASFSKEKTTSSTYGDLNALMIFSLCGGLILLGSKDFFMFFLGVEILSIPVYVLVGSKKNTTFAAEGALKYFFMGSFATAIMLLGIALVYGATGHFDLDITSTPTLIKTFYPEILLPVGVLLILGSLLFKLGGFPFHFWNPDIYQASAKSVLAFMVSVVKISVFVAAFKLFTFAFKGLGGSWNMALSIVIIGSVLVGYLSALNQQSLKRMISFTGISSTGFALLTLLPNEKASFDGLLVYLIPYVASTLMLLFIAMSIGSNEDRIEDFEGIGYQNPILGFLGLIAILSLMGIPPFSGFFGKFLILKDTFKEHHWLGLFGLLSSIFGAFVYLRLLLIFFKKPTVSMHVNLPNVIVIPLIFCGLLAIGGWVLVLF